MDSSLEERLLRLETNVTHMEHLCEQLNQVVTEQSKIITRLLAAQQQLSKSVESQELERIKATNAKPPHYSV
ncbi:MAG TPA: SlyX family protein [Verrucomicrobiae bacterium]